MVDTHAHLDGCAEGPDVLLARARDAGVTRVIAIGSGIESCRRALACAERESGVFAALGIHPHQAASDEAGRLAELEELLARARAVAVGEAGLDFYRDYAPREKQLQLFEAQLELASRLEKPIVVHCRAAGHTIARALARFDGTVVLHCFSSPELLPVALERGYYVSFAGNLTYPRSTELRACAARVPGDRVLTETDSPYLAPQPRRGRPNEPANLAFTVAALAAARSQAVDELISQLDENAASAFGLP